MIMQERTKLERNWAYLLGAFASTLLGMLVWLQGVFFVVAGGAIALFVVGTAMFALRMSHPAMSPLLSRLAFLTYALLLLNLATGLTVRLQATVGILGAALFLPFLASLVTCVAIGSALVFDVTDGRYAPEWQANLGRRLAISTFIAVALFSVVWVLGAIVNPALGVALGPLAGAIIFAHCTFVGVAVIRAPRVPGRIHTAVPVRSRVVWFVVAWLILGFGSEVVRGEWVLWSFTSMAILSTVLWVKQLVSPARIL